MCFRLLFSISNDNNVAVISVSLAKNNCMKICKHKEDINNFIQLRLDIKGENLADITDLDF